jgi:hypothetical protein
MTLVLVKGCRLDWIKLLDGLDMLDLVTPGLSRVT